MPQPGFSHDLEMVLQKLLCIGAVAGSNFIHLLSFQLFIKFMGRALHDPAFFSYRHVVLIFLGKVCPVAV
tara:strand:+ start:42675 stop:42884 length:210 start_codon:yes stop_codon:yes gene_type:complete